MTSKLQLTLPKAIADQYGIRAGDDLQWVPAGETIRVIPADKKKSEEALSRQARLELFDQATQRQQRREATLRKQASASAPDRNWKREDLYRRGRAD